jgi:hypothetical protein
MKIWGEGGTEVSECIQSWRCGFSESIQGKIEEGAKEHSLVSEVLQEEPRERLEIRWLCVVDSKIKKRIALRQVVQDDLGDMSLLIV